MTRSASPARIGTARQRVNCGGCWRSPSITTRTSPLAATQPAVTAPANPPLRSRPSRSIRVISGRVSLAAAMSSGVPSSLSSTKISCQLYGLGFSEAVIASIKVLTLPASFRVGTITLMSSRSVTAACPAAHGSDASQRRRCPSRGTPGGVGGCLSTTSVPVGASPGPPRPTGRRNESRSRTTPGLWIRAPQPESADVKRYQPDRHREGYCELTARSVPFSGCANGRRAVREIKMRSSTRKCGRCRSNVL